MFNLRKKRERKAPLIVPSKTPRCLLPTIDEEFTMFVYKIHEELTH